MKKIILISIFTSFFIHFEVKAQTTTYYRGALLEYFQGHLCDNCPLADSVARFIKAKYGDSVAVVDIHAGVFALTDSLFPDSLSCNTGEVLYNFFTDGFIPVGLISRTDFDTSTYSHLKPTNAWDISVNSIIQQQPLVLVGQNNNFNNTTHILNLTVYTKALITLTGNYYLSAFLTEDSIISRMTTFYGIDTNYVINNLLRAGLNGDWGTLINSGTFLSGSTITNNFSFQLNPTWNINHCNVICFVYDNTTKEVIQISQKALLDYSTSPISINEINNYSSINICPNPATSNLTIDVNENLRFTNYLLRIYDVIGNLIFEKNLNNNKTNVDVSALPSGLYFIKVETEKGELIKKFVKE